MAQHSINGQSYFADAPPDTPLLWVLREDLRLTGTRFGCGKGLCGSCTVHINGQSVRSCQVQIKDVAADAQITTIEGLSTTHTIDLNLQDPISIMQPLWAVALALAIEPMSDAQRALVEPAMLALAEPGFGLSALQYRRIEREREILGRRMNQLHQTYDLLITPQMPITAFEVGHEVPPGGPRKRWWEWSPFTYPFNLTQQPTATVPCGFVNGLPVAMQLVGGKYADAKVLRAARAYESVQPFVMPVFQPHD